MVFGHGFGLDQSCWRDVLPAFEDDHRLVTFDYTGSGRSDRTAYDPLRYATLDGYAQDLLDVLEALEIWNCMFVGASISGMLGIMAALRAPARIASLVLIGASARYIDDPPHYRGGFQPEDVEGSIRLMDENFIGWADHMARAAIKDPSISRELKAGICAIDPKIARRFAATMFRCDQRALLPRCEQPVLLVQCAHDDLVPFSAARYLEQHLPNARMTILQAAGHCPQLTHPRELAALIAEFSRLQESRP